MVCTGINCLFLWVEILSLTRNAKAQHCTRHKPPISIITESFKPSKAKVVKTDSNKVSYGVAVCRNTSKLSRNSLCPAWVWLAERCFDAESCWDLLSGVYMMFWVLSFIEGCMTAFVHPVLKSDEIVEQSFTLCLPPNRPWDHQVVWMCTSIPVM